MSDLYAPVDPLALPPVVLRRRTTTALWWGVLALLLVGAGAVLVVDTGGHPVTWAVLAVFVVVAGFFLGQLLVPGLVEVRLERDALRARAFGRRTEAPWELVHVARVRRLVGDPVLILELREPRPTGTLATYRTVAVLLPLGCDVDALHDFLARRLGRGRRLAAPTSLRPLDL